ncbi:MAG: glycosyltransferase [Atribacterota bacterium]
MNKPRTKVAFFLPSLEGGGAERSIVNLFKNLNKRNYKISLILGERKGDFIEEVPKEVLIVDLKTSNSFKIFFKIIRYFRKEKPDIFISTFPRFNIINIIAKIFSKVKTKIIITERTTFSLLSTTAETFSHRLIARFLLPSLIRFIYPKADVIVCISKGIAHDISKIIRYADNKIRVIYNPVTDERIYKLAKESVKYTWFSNLEIPVILSVGRLIKAKDYPNLLQSFSLVLQKQPAHLVILGEGTEKEKLKRVAQKLGIFKNVAFLGFQKNPYKYMARCSVFVLSSYREGFGDVLVEAMACGVPVVSTNCPGPKDIIESGKNGILVPIDNKKALAEAILKVLNNPYLSYKLSKEGKKRASFFSIKKSAKEYEKLFQELLNLK